MGRVLPLHINILRIVHLVDGFLGSMELARADEILEFWFGSEPSEFREVWFKKDGQFDREIRGRFLEDYERAVNGEYDDWEKTARGSLALILIFDQFPRNMFRDSARAFATDPQARHVAAHTVSGGFDVQLSAAERLFVYLPFEHSESLEDQRRSVELFAGLEREAPDSDVLRYAVRHWETIDRFGRFPYRNAALGRQKTRWRKRIS
jgi:uncharacterized protein (DUF924 family)